MSAAELRQAAETLRERAQAATGKGAEWFIADCDMYPRWILAEDGHAKSLVTPGDYYNSDVLRITEEDEQFEASDADWTWIATMHPGVGLALADVLDMAAAAFESVGFPAPEHEGTFPIIRLASLINGGAL